MYEKSILDNSVYIPHIHFLYYYGCRIGETFHNRITHIDQNEYLHILPQKKNNERKIKIKTDLCYKYITELQQSNLNQNINYKGLQRYLNKIISIRNLSNGNKNISAHLFRHNYIRSLNAKGYTIKQINKHLGYTHQSVKNTYLKGLIHYLE